MLPTKDLAARREMILRKYALICNNYQKQKSGCHDGAHLAKTEIDKMNDSVCVEQSQGVCENGVKDMKETEGKKTGKRNRKQFPNRLQTGLRRSNRLAEN
jgi:hypothetical protein